MPLSKGKRERLADEILKRLKKIDGTGPYHYDLNGSVERKIHEWEVERRAVDARVDPPGIEIEALSSRSTIITVGEWSIFLSFDLVFYLAGDTASAADIDAANEDISRALLTDENGLVDAGFGVGATEVELSDRLFELETGAPEDGLVVTFSCRYTDLIGRPAQV